MGAIGDEGLGAVQDPSRLVLVEARHGPGARCIGTGLRLGQPPGTDPLSSRQLRQIAALLFLITGDEDVPRTQGIVSRNAEGHGGIDPGQLLDHGDVLQIPEPRAAVLLGNHDSQETQLGELAPDLVRKSLRLIPFANIRPDLLLSEPTDHVGN